MNKKKKPDEIDELVNQTDNNIPDVFDEDGESDEMTPEEYRSRPHEEPIDNDVQLARVKIADKIIDPPEDRICEVTWTSKGLYVPLCLKETINYICEVPKKGRKKMRASTYLINRLDKRARAIDGRLIARMTILAGDESRSKEEEENPWDRG